MLTLNYSNITKISQTHGLSQKEINSKKHLIPSYLKKIHSRDQGFYKVITESTTEIKKFATANKNRYQHFVVLGIGGSALGTICLQQSLTHLFKPQKLHVIDNIDPILIKELEDIIDLKKTLFIVISKSGTTLETLSQYNYFRRKTDLAKLDPKKHFVFITDPKSGTLRKIAGKEKIPCFDVPENIGGRFSVLTAVGLLPAALIGINIDKLLKGARKGKLDFFPTEKNLAKKNTCFTLATIQYLLYKKNKNINVLMPYAQKLIRLTDWYSQLLAESIGKKSNIGITPVRAVGATDQHSQIQLYNDGPNDKLSIFMDVKKPLTDMQIPGSITFHELLQTEKTATAQALTKNNRPNITIEIDSICEETLGELFMFFEGTTAFLGEFFNINAFNQPGVELGKKLTEKMLNA